MSQTASKEGEAGAKVPLPEEKEALGEEPPSFTGGYDSGDTAKGNEKEGSSVVKEDAGAKDADITSTPPKKVRFQTAPVTATGANKEYTPPDHLPAICYSSDFTDANWQTAVSMMEHEAASMLGQMFRHAIPALDKGIYHQLSMMESKAFLHGQAYATQVAQRQQQETDRDLEACYEEAHKLHGKVSARELKLLEVQETLSSYVGKLEQAQLDRDRLSSLLGRCEIEHEIYQQNPAPERRATSLRNSCAGAGGDFRSGAKFRRRRRATREYHRSGATLRSEGRLLRRRGAPERRSGARGDSCAGAALRSGKPLRTRFRVSVVWCPTVPVRGYVWCVTVRPVRALGDGACAGKVK